MSEGPSKSRAVLGDLTNQLGKRGFSERGKRGIKSLDFNDRDAVAKRIRVSSRPCSGINSLKGDIKSSISNITDENWDSNVSNFGCSAVSKSSIGVGTDCDDGYCLKRKTVVDCHSKVHGGSKLDDGNDMVDSYGKIGYLGDASVPNTDKMAGRDYKGLNLMNLVGRRARNSVSHQNDCRSEFDLLKEKEISGTAKRVCENKSASLNHTVGGNVFDLTRNGKGEGALCSSEVYKGKYYLSLIHLGRGNAFQSADVEADDELCDSFPVDNSTTVRENGGHSPHDGRDLNVDESRASSEGTQSDIGDYQNDGDDYDNADNLVSSQCGSIDCTILPESQESRAFGVEKSAELKKGDECALSGGTDLIKACSCSFCTQAAYIWLDLNYQDIKARVSGMRKIQKEANILAERSIRNKVTEKHGAESFTGVPELESDLMHQWRSLFQHMADILEEESNQIEARLLPLMDLRQKCKTDLALINAPPFEKR